MAILTEEQIEKIARNLILAPQIMEAHPVYIKLQKEDFDGNGTRISYSS